MYIIVAKTGAMIFFAGRIFGPQSNDFDVFWGYNDTEVVTYGKPCKMPLSMLIESDCTRRAPLIAIFSVPNSTLFLHWLVSEISAL